MYRSIALPTVSEAGAASAFIPAFIAAALDSAAFFEGIKKPINSILFGLRLINPPVQGEHANQ